MTVNHLEKASPIYLVVEREGLGSYIAFCLGISQMMRLLIVFGSAWAPRPRVRCCSHGGATFEHDTITIGEPPAIAAGRRGCR
jgi:hypothetical protein